jgi:hypothetical protein
MSDKIKYYSYIKSEAWQRKRRQFYSSNMFKCFEGAGKWNCYCCEMTDVSLDLHHRTYKRLGKEKIHIDLVPVCRPCHEDIHFLVKEKDFGLWVATKAVRKKRKKDKK